MSAVTHDFAALAYYVGGRARIEQRGVWTIEAGDVLIVPSGEPHRLVEAHAPDMWRLAICVPCLSTMMPSLPDPFERVRDGASPVVRIPRQRRAFLTSLFEELAACSPVDPAEEAVRHSLLRLIVHEITRAAGWSPAPPAAADIVTESLRYIERHCCESLTLTRVAAAMDRTPSYVTTALTRATGRSAGAWIIAGRMAEARRRLLHSDENVAVIAERVGYEDATHFIRLFRRMHGATPAAWRSAQRRPNLST